MLIDVLAELGVDGERVEGRSGVWIARRSQRDEKIAAIGIRVAEGVTMHGFALNCSNGFEAYDAIVACGIRDAGDHLDQRACSAARSPRRTSCRSSRRALHRAELETVA